MDLRQFYISEGVVFVIVFGDLLRRLSIIALRMLVRIICQLVGAGGRIYLEYTHRHVVKPVESSIESRPIPDETEVDEIDK